MTAGELLQRGGQVAAGHCRGDLILLRLDEGRGGGALGDGASVQHHHRHLVGYQIVHWRGRTDILGRVRQSEQRVHVASGESRTGGRGGWGEQVDDGHCVAGDCHDGAGLVQEAEGLRHGLRHCRIAAGVHQRRGLGHGQGHIGRQEHAAGGVRSDAGGGDRTWGWS